MSWDLVRPTKNIANPQSLMLKKALFSIKLSKFKQL